MSAHEAGGVTSNHDVEIFRAWKKAEPGYEWSEAKVHRFDGLTLIGSVNGLPNTLHFAHALCGYVGSGPHASATILHEAGFGEFKELLARVTTDEQNVTISK